MRRRVVIRPRAVGDLDEYVDYLALRSPAAAERFRARVSETWALLAEYPGIGRLRRYTDPEFAGVRSIPVRGFPNHLIFYRATEKVLDVIRVLHGARDLDAIFGGED
jgi:toxin ParE1/3/4